LDFYRHNPIEAVASAGQHFRVKIIPLDRCNSRRPHLHKIKKDERAGERKCV
jgi:hypothetical protein